MITLIATGHKERGICNSNELYKIIERIAPEIIFEEIPPGKFAAVYGGTRHDSLETKAIKAYIQKHPNIVHLPVDLNVDKVTEMSIRIDFNGMSNIFRDYNSEYNSLINEIRYMSAMHGFAFLNSDQCVRLLERQLLLDEVILKNLKEDPRQANMNHENMAQAYKTWLTHNDDRNNEMIKNIYNYSRVNIYNKALFLVGATHRRPIMNKIPDFEKENNCTLNWDCDFFKNRSR